MIAELIVFLIVGVVLAIVICFSRKFYCNFINPQQQFIVPVFYYWFIIIFSLITAFTISTFYTRYIEHKDFFVNGCKNLTIIYEEIRLGPQDTYSRKALRAIKRYVSYLVKSVIPNLYKVEYSEKAQKLYQKMNDAIINYTYNNANIQNGPTAVNILNRLSTDQELIELLLGIQTGQFLIYIIIFLAVFYLFFYWFVKLDNIKFQFIIDLSTCVIIFVSIYLLSVLNNPFVPSPIYLDLNIYTTFLKNIQKNSKNN